MPLDFLLFFSCRKISVVSLINRRFQKSSEYHDVFGSFVEVVQFAILGVLQLGGEEGGKMI